MTVPAAPWRWTFGGVKYVVEMPLTETADGHPCPSLRDIRSAERSALLAALSDGVCDPKTLRYARWVVPVGKAVMAARLGLSTKAFVAMENNVASADRPAYVCLLTTLVRQSDLGEFIALRAP